MTSVAIPRAAAQIAYDSFPALQEQMTPELAFDSMVNLAVATKAVMPWAKAMAILMWTTGRVTSRRSTISARLRIASM